MNVLRLLIGSVWSRVSWPQGPTLQHDSLSLVLAMVTHTKVWGCATGNWPEVPRSLNEQNDGEGSGISLLVCTRLSLVTGWILNNCGLALLSADGLVGHPRQFTEQLALASHLCYTQHVVVPYQTRVKLNRVFFPR